MKTEFAIFLIQCITIGALLLAIIYTAGVVWRVEMELDVSYKFFLAAVIFFAIAEIFDIFPSQTASSFVLAIKSLRMVSAACFLAGVLFMRDIVRKADGEKSSPEA